jgi:hypothetical protein
MAGSVWVRTTLFALPALGLLLLAGMQGYLLRHAQTARALDEQLFVSEGAADRFTA